MNIINSSKELNARETYSMTRDAKIQKMSDAVGHVITPDMWVMYEDETTTRNGELLEVRTVLSIRDVNGSTFATVSRTFIEEFGVMAEIFENDIPPILVISSKSKAGREFITCALAD